MNAPMATEAGAAERTLASAIDGRRLTVGLLGNRVVWARHEGAINADEAAVLQRTCDEMTGYTLREAAEHAAIYAASALVRDGKLLRAPGISLPRAVSSDLARAEALAREIYRNSPFREEDANTWNFEDRGLSIKWTAQGKQKKIAVVRELQMEFFRDRKLADGMFSIVDIDQHERIDVSFEATVPVSEKPGILMDFERFLRRSTGERVEVFVTEMKDLNRIRRL
jgi:hypothetical protein